MYFAREVTKIQINKIEIQATTLAVRQHADSSKYNINRDRDRDWEREREKEIKQKQR